MPKLSLLRSLAAVLMLAAFGGGPGCICIEMDACLKFCEKVVDECNLGGCTCSIDRCKNSLDVAGALNECYDLPCDEYIACANQAIATCELKDEWLDAGGQTQGSDAHVGVDSAAPDTSQPDTSRPDSSLPDTLRPDAARPDLALPDLWLPDLVYPDHASTDTASVDTARPDIALPDVVLPDMAGPDRHDAALTADCPSSGIPCDDGEWCTVNDTCVGTLCTGEPRDCDEGIACTPDSCNEHSDRCEHGAGVPTPGLEGYMGDPTCSNNLDDDCDGYTDAGDTECWLQGCSLPGDCDDDGNDCTVAICDLDYCEHIPLADRTGCAGSNACTTRFWCQDGLCVPGPSNTDADEDGAVDDACPGGLDCDDGDAARHPGAEGPRGHATCSDTVDNDCDGLVDQFDPHCWTPSCTASGFCRENPVPNGGYLLGVWSGGADLAFAVGGDGLILRWDGSGWSTAASPTSADLRAVSGCAADDVWAVGDLDGVLHWDGIEWAVVDKGAGSSLQDVSCVSGTDPTEVWAVGGYSFAAHWVGDEQAVGHSTGAGASLNGLWVRAADDVWVVGNAGAMAHYDAGIWTPEVALTGEDLDTLWGQNGELWAAGDNGVVLYHDGLVWAPEASGLGSDFRGLWGASATDLWGVTIWGNSVVHRDQGVWSRVPVDPPVPYMYDIWGSAGDDIWAVGGSAAIYHWDGVAWRTPSPTSEPLYDFCVIEPGTGEVEAWAVGDVAMRWDGSQWRQQFSFGNRMRGIFCRGSEDIWAVGDDGWMYHWDGMSWEELDAETTEDLYSVHGQAAGEGEELWAVGTRTVLRWDGEVWSEEQVGVSAQFFDVWVEGPGSAPRVWVAGSAGHILSWDAGRWQATDSHTSEMIQGLWGDGSGTLLAAGSNNTVLSWSGTDWVSVAEPGWGFDYADIAGSSADDLWLPAYRQLIHWDGQTWSAEDLGVYGNEAVAASPSGHVWMGGGWGNILHRSP